MNQRGEKYFLAIEDSVRESAQSWRGGCLLKLKSHGIDVSRLAFGDGAMGFWAGAEGSLSANPPPAVLDAQNDERAESVLPM